MHPRPRRKGSLRSLAGVVIVIYERACKGNANTASTVWGFTMSWRVSARALLVLLVVLAIAAWGTAASATTSSVRSEPNGDIRVTVSAGTLTDRDGDGDFDTGMKGDTASLFFAVANQSSVSQRVRIDYVLDGPGTELDRVVTQEVVLEPDGIHQERAEFKVQQKTPRGGYNLTVAASGTETATAIATFTLN
jgi:hypothetical protein